ncbi:hypothetical protein [Ectobacillus panaciterrae]|uniref:hypothetical protein n=1 Tax=Ectobacillus panaciterrae TaxID=363872 RepID=UPI0004255AFC|nr:hypothetical protein [Ectobacillus panaciterrae]
MDERQLQALYEYMTAQGVSRQEMSGMLQSLPKWIIENEKAPCKEDGEAGTDSDSDLGAWLSLSNEDSLL